MLAKVRMTSRLLLLLSGLSLSGCAHGSCQAFAGLFGYECVRKRPQPETQDPRIVLPVFDHTLQPDADLDGYTLQAIRIAADDLLNADSTGLPCGEKQVSYRYRAVRRADIIFVRIEFKPQNCGRSVGMLDDGATYAIGVDGRILRRELDGG
jgi:hypothetical protein